MKIREMISGQNKISLYIKLKEIKTAKNGNKYTAMTLADGEQEIMAQMWEDLSDSMIYEVGKVLSFIVEKGEYAGRPSYKVVSGVPDLEADVSKYIESTPYTPEYMYNEIMETIKGMKDADYQSVAGNIVYMHREKLMNSCGAKNIHHAIKSGLLWHVFSMLQMAKAIAPLYPINSDILYAGVILHDIGKIEQLDTNDKGMTEYTVPGNLIGHICLGDAIVCRYAAIAKRKVPEEKLEIIRHMILSHHGRYEWGSPVLPMIPEAMILHYLDMIDSREYQFDKYQKSTAPGTFSERIGTLDKMPVYNPINTEATSPVDFTMWQDGQEG